MEEEEYNDTNRKRILDGLHYYLCSRDYNINFDETIENINVNIEGDNENLKNDVENNLENVDLKQNMEKPKEYSNLAKIPLQFNDTEDYIKTFELHLFTEAKSQIQKAQIQEGSAPEKMRILSSTQKKHKNNESLFFRTLKLERLEINQTQYVAHDFVLLSLTENEISPEHMLGVVERAQGNQINVKVVFDEFGTDIRNKKLCQIFTQDDENVWRFWQVKKFCNIVTIQREYEALQAFGKIELKEYLITPQKLLKQVHEQFAISENLEIKLQETYNLSQIEAIKATLRKEGITLIQGPPGTGKTRTVLGTVSVLINSFNKQVSKKVTQESKFVINQGEFDEKKVMAWMQPNYCDWRDQCFANIKPDFSNFTKSKGFVTAGMQGEQISVSKTQEEHTPPQTILICGPSNAAIDEIVRKVKSEGLLDKNGKQYFPNNNMIVRIGENFDRALEDISLEYQVKQKLGEMNLRAEEAENIRKKILQEAKIICGTLSSAGSQLLINSNFYFDTVIIDEAAQAAEISTLIPLQYHCKRLILIGDPNQLPATIFSKKCEKFNYDQSLFERLMKCGLNVYMLKQQYRMNPIISKFISNTFYEGKIDDAQKIKEIVGNPEFYQFRIFSPIVVLNVNGNEIFHKSSYKNEEESEAIVEIYAQLKKRFPSFDLTQLGIITPYSSQVSEIRRKIKQFDGTDKCLVEVHTVDGFQGREKDIIIFSTVRASIQNGVKNNKKTIGFLNDKRRMNVSLSRARLSLIVVGDLKQLKYSKLWKGLAEYSLQLNSCYNMVQPFQRYVDNLELHTENYKIFRI
ncbi:hypothetical protein IMG5_129630 [Ichthyophthirius multifiliis]|uniref:Uncharacterized protein n=1 Tax=Ichthyophthirius multifiliis TaxID=5932 RepID=G0QW64_ICHMU|nr:hypothetical protein IMG5_129630 [Ichthyophthirius multifiliis]EGR30545.1 hypothetical protein IMG5_129630 [Ichthyophthirius multifiliis]|eukprot:XP_004032132.1 hypothetical protein IMG5_129630 [Ichthyophthirius multifiliis]